MINLDDVQADIIAFLKSQSGVTALVSAVEIRELQWQGHTFTYPNIRLAVAQAVPIGRDECREENLAVALSIFAFSEKDSSNECIKILSAIQAALANKQIPSTSYRAGPMHTGRVILPIRASERIWRGQVMLDVNAYKQ